jgi:hypothetical protein
VSISGKQVPLSKTEALETARKCLNAGQVVYTNHFKRRMNEKKVSLQDVINLIDNGQIDRDAEWNDDYMEYHYRITGEDIEGVSLTVVIAISISDAELRLITAFD